MIKPGSILLALVFCLPLTAQAQTDQAAKREPRATDRMFLTFGQEATLVDRQWWEGQVEYLDLASGFDVTILRLVAAFQPWNQVELGGTVGFGDTDYGSGATDLDFWAKYHFGKGGKTEYAAGGLLVVPTGDDAAGLGNDSFAFGGFGSFRHRAKRATFAGNLAVRLNSDGVGNRDGETSFELGGGVIIPTNDKLSFIGEVRFESERLRGYESDLRALGGINLAAGKSGAFRAALALGLTDGAPDLQVIAGYASTF
jgi:hypothetical protein